MNYLKYLNVFDGASSTLFFKESFDFCLDIAEPAEGYHSNDELYILLLHLL